MEDRAPVLAAFSGTGVLTPLREAGGQRKRKRERELGNESHSEKTDPE
jgi:hypothetical protein